ncbi:MAG TPA: molybdopterin cofactor-binding domain-containing protein [Verrucomicrobiae bacterium]|nr:molybdopterin cofactor-binding domain-containing protein [Verrucomicrobiae bacterium]
MKNNQAKSEPLFEAERYELAAAPFYHFDLDRREFFKTLGCGIVVLLFIEAAVAQESGGRERRRGRPQRPAEISAWLHIGENGTVTVFNGKAEMGQNIRTSLSQAVAEELHAPIDSIKLVMADTDLTPWDAGTFGSRSTPDMGLQLRRVSAAAREALLDLAAEHFKTDRASLTVADGKISKSGGGEAIGFGELTRSRELVKSVAEETKTAPATDWKIAGTSVPKVDGRDFVTGRHQYASDIRRPGMLRGKVLRPSAFDAKLKSLDTKLAEAISGVTIVHDGNFVGVTAPNTLIASRAINAIQAEWTSSSSQPSSNGLFDYLRKNSRGSGNENFSQNEDSSGQNSAEHRLKQTYTIAYIAHAPLEPRAAVAEWNDGKLTVWTGTQRPFGVRGELARAFGISEEKIRVIVPDTGSAYGGKHTGETAIEAARLAKGAGKPVKLVWTREEEFTWAYFRPAGVIDISSAVRADGTISAWEFHNYNSGGSGIRSPYDIPSQKTEFHQTDSPLRQGSYRALAATANHFAREVHMDELAAILKMDPLEFRLKNLKNDRLLAVLKAAADAFGWAKMKSSEDRGFGIACGTEKGSCIATCAEVLVDRKTGGVRVSRAVVAFECGAIVNPNELKSQVEGGAVMGIGGALFEAIQFENGRITNPHFASYRVPRFRDAPEIQVVLVNRKDLPSAGAGETPVMTIAPAIGNAIFAATGVRLRSMPMAPEGLKL